MTLTDVLSLDHYLGEAVDIIIDGGGLSGDLSLKVCTVSNLMYGPTVKDLDDNLPAVLISVEDDVLVNPDEDNLTGINFDIWIPIRIVYLAEFNIGDNVQRLKNQKIGKLYGLFVSAMTDGDAWTAASNHSQVFACIPSDVDLTPDEETVMRGIYTNRNIYGAAFTVNAHALYRNI